MDIYCVVCSEPWDMDSLHERVKELHPDFPWISDTKPPEENRPFMWEEFPFGIYGHREDKGRTGWYDPTVYQTYYQPIAKAFKTLGCKVLGVEHNEISETKNPELASLIYDIMGDDLDGAASAFEDAESMGLW